MLFIFLNGYLHCCAVMEENNPTRPCLFSYEIILFPQGNTCILATLKRACLHVPLFFLKYALISSREIEVQLCKIPREKSMSSVRGTIFVHLWCCWQQEVRYINNNTISNSTKSNMPWRTGSRQMREFGSASGRWMGIPGIRF
jgi:hypothetical protein